MNRITLAQALLNRRQSPNYMEIGSQYGVSFLPIRARRKIAVDPEFRISLKTKVWHLLRNPSNINNRYFEEDSAVFFDRRGAFLQRIGGLDVVLVDGLHTFEASLNDVRQSLRYLKPSGVIIMHDCYPKSAIAAMPVSDGITPEDIMAMEAYEGVWNGDVYKTILYLRRAHAAMVDVLVIDTDYGLGIVRKRESYTEAGMDIRQEIFDEVAVIGYDELIGGYLGELNLKGEDFGEKFINETAWIK